MYSEVHPFRIPLGIMSTPQFFLVEEDDAEIVDAKFKILSKDTLSTSLHPDETQVQGINYAPQSPDSSRIQEGNCEDEKFIEEDKLCADQTASVSSTESEMPRGLGRQSEVADSNDDDGFRTPTSSDHKIPTIAECPPAPMKTRPNPSAKRKVSPRIRRNLQLDLSREVELMFPPTTTLQDDDKENKIKKARTDDSD